MKTESIDQILIRPSVAARMIGVSRATIYALLRNRTIPSVRVTGSGIIRVPRAALDALVASATPDAALANADGEDDIGEHDCAYGRTPAAKSKR